MKMYFKNTQDRLDFIRGKHTEIVPIEVGTKEVEEAKGKSENEKEKKDAVQVD